MSKFYDDGKVDAVLAAAGPGPQGPQGAAGTGVQGPQGDSGASGLPMPGYTPPAFQYKDADEIYIPAGRYFPLGHRISGQYQGTVNQSHWDVSAAFAVDCDAVYEAGSSGLLGGLTGDYHWCSVFMLDSDEIIILPWIRVPAADYDSTHSGKTTITPGDYTATANTGIITGDDEFNAYRLVRHGVLGTSVHGYTATIEDTVNSSNELIIDGDVTAGVGTGDTDGVTSPWLQVIPPAATDCLYLGSLLFQADGTLRQFFRWGWRTTWVKVLRLGVNSNADNTTAGFDMTSIAAAVPPTATRVLMNWQVSNGNNSRIGNTAYLAGEDQAAYSGDWDPWNCRSGDRKVCTGYVIVNSAANYKQNTIQVPFYMTYPSAINNRCHSQDSSGVEYGSATTWGFVWPMVWEE